MNAINQKSGNLLYKHNDYCVCFLCLSASIVWPEDSFLVYLNRRYIDNKCLLCGYIASLHGNGGSCINEYKYCGYFTSESAVVFRLEEDHNLSVKETYLKV